MPGARISIKGFGSWGGRGGSGGSGRSKHAPEEGAHTPVIGVRGGGTTSAYSSGPSSESDEPHVRQQPQHLCYMDLQGFVACINTNASDISVCQHHFDAFMACKDACETQEHAQKKPKEPTGIWEYILP